MYRDGVGDGQLGYVRDTEVAAIKVMQRSLTKRVLFTMFGAIENGLNDISYESVVFLLSVL